MSAVDDAVEDTETLKKRETAVAVPSPVDPWTSEWTDVTDQFKGTAANLALGQLVHDNSFSLFEGMSAIELMDPKMDAGILHCSQIKQLTFETAVESGILNLTNVPPEELLAIMDASFACTLTWLDGHSLAKTVFTNLYCHNPHKIEHRILMVFVMGLLKLVDICGEVIVRAAVFEEEDFQPMTYGFDLCKDTSEARIISMLKEADDDCQKMIRSLKSNQEPSAQLQIKLHDAISARLRFLRSFIMALQALTRKEDPKQLSSSNKPGTSATPNVEDALRALNHCSTYVTKMEESVGLGVQLPDDDETYSGLKVFVPNFNQRLLPPLFPRPTVLLGRTVAIEHLKKLVQQLVQCCSLLDRVSSFSSALKFFRDFSQKENCVLSRSVLQLIYNNGNRKVANRLAFVDVVKEAVREFVNPPILNPKTALQTDDDVRRQALQSFLNNSCEVLPDLIRTCGHNRARQRDKLASVLDDLAGLQEEAEKLDGVLDGLSYTGSGSHAALVRRPSASFSSFILYHTLLCMLDYLLLGFELELYAVHEHACMYWYLHELLYKWLINVLCKADSCMYEEEQSAGKSEKSKAEKKKKQAKKKASKGHQAEIITLQARQKLCEGYYRALLGFYAMDRIRAPPLGKNGAYEAIRYEHRLASFARLATPPMISYDQYLEISNFKEIVDNYPSSHLFMEAARSFDEARLTLETAAQTDEDDGPALVRICKTNVVTLRLLASGHQSNAKEWPLFAFNLHKNFSVVKLK